MSGFLPRGKQKAIAGPRRGQRGPKRRCPGCNKALKTRDEQGAQRCRACTARASRCYRG